MELVKLIEYLMSQSSNTYLMWPWVATLQNIQRSLKKKKGSQ